MIAVLTHQAIFAARQAMRFGRACAANRTAATAMAACIALRRAGSRLSSACNCGAAGCDNQPTGDAPDRPPALAVVRIVLTVGETKFDR
jgi:hypothetical protein